MNIKAKEYFEAKMAFTTGPAEVDDMIKNHREMNIIDVRAAEDYADGHVPGAVSLPEEKWQTMAGLTKDKLNVIYCYSHVCHLAAKAAVLFAGQGFSVMEMDGGYKAWTEQGLDIEKGAMGHSRATTSNRSVA